MTSITTRAGKGSPLTHNEVDANFTNLNNDKLDTAGIALGSAASPTLKFTGDPNTGIYSPGADQLAVSTGGTGRLFVDASGNVGIGTTSPAGQLQVALASSYAPGASWDDKTVVFGGTGSFSGAVGIAYDDTNGGYISSIVPGSAWKPLTLRGSYLSFAIDAAGERLRIDSSGRLLVGTSSARSNVGSINQEVGGGNLVVSSFLANAFAYGFAFVKSRSTTTLGTILSNGDQLGPLSWYGDDGSSTPKPAASIDCFVDGTPGANDMPGRLVFSTAADGAASPTERMRITSGGNVGIGVSSPSSPLEVAGQINAVAPFAGFAAFQTAAGTGFRWALNNDGTFFLQRTTDGFATGSISINVDSLNRVGIGTTSPTTLLDVNTDTVRVRIARTPASAAATGATGEICWDANYIYVCTATNTWKRSALSTW